MSQQSLQTECLNSPVYSYSNKLKVAEPFKPLKAVFITPKEYLSGVNIQDDVVPTKVPTSVYSSIVNPKLDCEYLRWEQISPPNRATYGLSWLFVSDVGEDPRELIQFLTSQLSYRVEWKLTAIATVDYPSPVTLVLPESTVGYEPPDICGNKIKFEVPTRRGTITSGQFVLPGQYGQFVISAPDRNVSMTLRVTGYIDGIDEYAVVGMGPTEFYVRTSDCNTKMLACTRPSDCSAESVRILAYTNSIISTSISKIGRTVSPQLATLERLIIEEYRSNPFFPCFTPNNVGSQAPPSNVTTSLVTYSLDTFPGNPIGMTCGNSYTNPIVDAGSLSPVGGLVSLVADGEGQLTQFSLQCGRSYKLKIAVKFTSGDFNGKSALFPLTVPGDRLKYYCPLTDFCLLFYDVAAKEPAQYDPTLSKPRSAPPDAGNGIVALLTIGGFVRSAQGLYRPFYTAEDGKDHFYIFTVEGDPRDSKAYATRINSPLWSTYPNADAVSFPLGVSVVRIEMEFSLV